MIISFPAPFPGTEQEKAENRLTHNFVWDEDARCFDCDCRPSSNIADWPCGEEPPRVEVVR